MTPPKKKKTKTKTKTKLKLWRLPNIAISICEERMLSLWLIYIGEKKKTLGGNFGQRIWNIVRCFWEHPWRTSWGTLLRTYGIYTRKKKFHPHPN